MITAGATEKELARFWAKVEKRGPDECWSWTAAVSNHGTPVLYWVDKNYTVMRVMWELEYGEAAPSGRALHRTCRTLGCVNPGHWKLRGSGQDADQHRWEGELVKGSRLCAATEELLVRFWAKVEKRGDGECWPWTGCVGPAPQMKWGDGVVSALKIMYELKRGEAVPPGAQLRRTCGNLSCINPGHLKLFGNGQDGCGQDTYQHWEDRPDIFYLAALAGCDLVPQGQGRYRVLRSPDWGRV